MADRKRSQRKSHWPLVVLWCLVPVPFWGCTGGSGLPDPVEGTTDVVIDNMAFEPKNVTISRGESVRWINAESGIIPIPHSSTSGDPSDDDPGAIWDSGTIQPGESFTRQFDEVGVFEYYCTFHPQVSAMRNATVTVVEGEDQAP